MNYRLMSFGLGVAVLAGMADAGITRVELTPTDVGSANSAYFTTAPTADASLFFGFDGGADVRAVNFNTAPDGALVEGGNVNTQYQSSGVVMNDIRISAAIYGGNNYGTGYATEDNGAQIYTFLVPVVAVGIVNTSPDNDYVRFFSGPDGTGDMIDEFRDQEGTSPNFNIDRFVGGVATDGTRIGSFVVFNASGDLELDELIFVVPAPGGLGVLGLGLAAACRRRR